MNKVIAWVVGGVVVAGMAWSGQQSTKANRAEAMERFSITEIEQPIMGTCETMMSSSRLEFKSGIDTAFGCACVARQVTDHVDERDRSAAVTYLSRLVSVGKRAGSMTQQQEDEFYESLVNIQDNYKLSDKRAQFIISAAADAISHCADPRSVESAQQIASREAALEEMKANRAKKAQKTKDACEEVRRRGIETDRCDGK